MPRVEMFRYEMLASDRSLGLAKKVLSSLKANLKEARGRGLVAQNDTASVASWRS